MHRNFIALVAACTSALSAQSSIAATSAEALYEACSYLNQVVSGVSVPVGAMAKVQFCVGFVEAGTDGMLLGALHGASITAGMDSYARLRQVGVPFACVPQTITNIDRVRLFLRYYENHPARGKQHEIATTNAITALMNSVSEEHPCK